MMEFFSKVTYLQFTDCNVPIKELLHRSYSEFISKANCLKKNILAKKSRWTSVLLKLSRQSRQLYQKTELILEPSVEALQVLIYLQENLVADVTFQLVQISCRSRVYPSNLSLKELHHKHISEMSLPDIFQQSSRSTVYRLQLYQK